MKNPPIGSERVWLLKQVVDMTKRIETRLETTGDIDAEDRASLKRISDKATSLITITKLTMQPTSQQEFGTVTPVGGRSE